jgi:hypothetical protein
LNTQSLLCSVIINNINKFCIIVTGNRSILDVCIQRHKQSETWKEVLQSRERERETKKEMERACRGGLLLIIGREYSSTYWLLLQATKIATSEANQHRLAIVEQRSLEHTVSTKDTTTRKTMMATEEERKLLLALWTRYDRVIRKVHTLDTGVAVGLQVLLDKVDRNAGTILSVQPLAQCSSNLLHLPARQSNNNNSNNNTRCSVPSIAHDACGWFA